MTDWVIKVEFVEALRTLEKAVSKMAGLYSRDESLNERYNIREILPASIDEWSLLISKKIKEIEAKE